MNKISKKETLKMRNKSWFARWWVWGLAALLIAIPFIINISYMTGYIEKTAPNTSFSSDQLLIFYGTILSFGGTVFLGTVALIQNRRLMKLQNNQNCIQLFNPRFKIFEALNKLLLDLINERYSDSDGLRKMINEYRYTSNGVKFLMGNEIFDLGQELIGLANKMRLEHSRLDRYKNIDKQSNPEDQQKAIDLSEKYIKLQEQIISEWVLTRKIEIAFEKYMDVKYIKAKDE